MSALCAAPGASAVAPFAAAGDAPPAASRYAIPDTEVWNSRHGIGDPI